MLQNRVDPFGNIIKTSARGAWMGNRGILHDDNQRICRLYKSKSWLTCVLQFRGRKRQVMAPGRYTELFFWDEAISFSAGHRPCFECRRKDAERFKSCWLAGNPGYGFDEGVSILEIDKIIHRERIGWHGLKNTHEERLHTLPDGCFISYRDMPYIIVAGAVFPWSDAGYGDQKELPSTEWISVLTPASIVNAFRAGYKPWIRM